MTVEESIQQSIHPGQELRTPARDMPFWVERIDKEGVVLLLGRKRWPTRLSWSCLEGAVPFIRERGGEVPIGRAA
jgi:hypothetical protein